MGVAECVSCKDKYERYTNQDETNIRIVKYINILNTIGNAYMVHNEDNSILTFSNDMNIRLLKYDIFEDDYYIDYVLPNQQPLNVISSVCLFEDNCILIGYETGELKLFDINEKHFDYSGYCHKSKIKKIIHLYYDEFITISDETNIKVWSKYNFSLKREYYQESIVNDLILFNNYIGITSGMKKDLYIWNFQTISKPKKIDLDFNVKNMCYIENEVLLTSGNSIYKMNIGNNSINLIINIDNQILNILPLSDKTMIIVIYQCLLHLDTNYKIIAKIDNNELGNIIGIFNIINDRKFIIGDNCGRLYLYKY